MYAALFRKGVRCWVSFKSVCSDAKTSAADGKQHLRKCQNSLRACFKRSEHARSCLPRIAQAQENKDAASKTNSSACTRHGVTAPSKSGGKAERGEKMHMLASWSSEEGLVFLFTSKLMQYGGGGQQCGRVRAGAFQSSREGGEH